MLLKYCNALLLLHYWTSLTFNNKNSEGKTEMQDCRYPSKCSFAR